MNTEYWLSGIIENVPKLLQPVAHSLLQTHLETTLAAKDLNERFLWTKPAGRASVAFHIQHICGVLDRMITYAKGEMLTEKQLDQLSDEGQPFRDIHVEDLVQQLDKQFEETLKYLSTVDENTLLEERSVGRKKLPSTVIGLLFHAAEHTQRHLGQLLVTASVVQNGCK